MRVVRNTSEQIILRSVPWLIALLLCVFLLGAVAFGLQALFEGNRAGAFWAGLFVPAFVGLFIIMFVRRDEAILDRSRDLLELRHATLLRRQKIQHKLHHLERAVVQTSKGKNGPTHRIALILTGGMDAGTHPVSPVYVSGRGAQRAADAVNAWLSDNVDSDTRRA